MFNNRKMEFAPKEDEIEVLDSELIKSMEDILKNEEVEMVSTLNEKVEENIDIFDVRLDEEIDTLPLINEEDKENINEQIKEETKEELLKTEYITTFFFYRVKKNENLDDILNRFQMSFDEFKKMNNKIEVKENDLIQIKLK